MGEQYPTRRLAERAHSNYQRNFDNWRGITLLSVPGKTLCKVILKRLETVIDLKLREEQAGFRRKRGCIDQIFALRNILEQCAEWNEQIHLDFVDF